MENVDSSNDLSPGSKDRCCDGLMWSTFCIESKIAPTLLNDFLDGEHGQVEERMELQFIAGVSVCDSGSFVGTYLQ